MARIIVIASADWQRLRDALLTPDGSENAGVLYCAPSSGKSTNKLLVRRFVPVPRTLYIERHSYHLEVSPSFYNSVVTDCLREKLTPVIVHSHPNHGETQYSRSDDYGEARLLPTLNSLLPGRQAASVVISYDSVTGRDFYNDQFRPLEGLFVIGANSFKRYFREANLQREDEPTERFDRQIRAFGREGQRTLADLRVAVVGVGGIGSLVAEQLVRAGIRKIFLIDDDRVESSNVSRLFGSQENDIGQWKAQVIAKYLSTLSHGKVEASRESAIRQSVLLSLRDYDVVFACVDNDRTRALLNRFAHQYLVPVIDHGTRLDGRDGNITAAAGRVSILGPGLTCLRCSHHLNPERIRAESMSRAERTRLAKEGYIMGIDEPAPAVVSINTVVAGLGVTAGINLFVNLTGRSQPVDQIYDASSGAVFPITPIHQRGCDICDETDGVMALGDLQIVSAYA